jgi:hypothetical protein
MDALRTLKTPDVAPNRLCGEVAFRLDTTAG